MSLETGTRGYKGRGEFILRPLSGGRPFNLGNATSFSESIEVGRSGRANLKNVAGGELDVEEVINSYTFEVAVDDISPEMLALGLRGTAAQVAESTITDEPQNAWAGVQQGLTFLPDPSNPVVVTIDASSAWAASTAYAVGDTVVSGARAYLAVVAGDSDSSEPTWPADLSTVVDNEVTWKDLGLTALIEDTDFSRTPHGIRILSTQSDRFHQELSIPLLCDYTRNPQYLIQALVGAGLEYQMEWHGLNSIDSGNPMMGRYFRVKFSPTSGFSRHGGDDFSSLSLSGTCLADESRVGAGESQYAETLMI